MLSIMAFLSLSSLACLPQSQIALEEQSPSDQSRRGSKPCSKRDWQWLMLETKQFNDYVEFSSSGTSVQQVRSCTYDADAKCDSAHHEDCGISGKPRH